MSILDSKRTHLTWLPFEDDATTRILLAGAFFMAAYFVVLLPPFLVDPRMLEGANVWLKPIKFSISLSLHFLTVAILAQLLPRAIRTGPSLAIATYLAIASLVLEAGMSVCKLRADGDRISILKRSLKP